jgi:hypothetical protein
MSQEGGAVDVYEPIYLCSDCRFGYRKAKYKLLPNFSDQTKGHCEICHDPEAIAYLIERCDTIPHCPRCCVLLTKTETMEAVFFSCRCGYEVQRDRPETIAGPSGGLKSMRGLRHP